MPQASDELRNKMNEYFGSWVNDWGPTAYLLDQGYTEKDYLWSKPTREHVPTEKEIDCLNFLRAEWDHDYDFFF
jgi:hypothetical protein